MRERFTVLGASGFIGSYLAAHLTRRGHECLMPERDESLDPRIDYGHVVYCIGLTSDFRTRPLETAQAHVCALLAVLRDVRFSSLTYLSSTRVYANASDTDEFAVLSLDVHVPDDLYNLSKLLGESLCLHAGRVGVRVARLSNVVGLRPDADIFIDQLLQEGFSRGAIQFRTSPGSAKDYVHIDDVVVALEGIALCGEEGIFNVASGEATTNEQIADFIQRYLGIPCDFMAGAPELRFEQIRINRAQATFGFDPQPFGEFFPLYLSGYQAARIKNP